MSKIRPLPGRLLVHNFLKGERNVSGIIIPDDDGKDTGVRSRWAQIYKTGDGIEDVKEGQWILIEHGRWTRSFEVDDLDNEEGTKLLWAVEYPDSVLAYSNEKPEDNTFA